MTKKKLFLYIQSALCVAFAAVLVVGAVDIYREGIIRRAEDPLAWIYTADAVARWGRPALAVGLAALALAVVGWILGVREADRSSRRPASSYAVKQSLRRGMSALRWALLAVAVGCIAAGVANGSMKDVLAKAISVCSECIGLG